MGSMLVQWMDSARSVNPRMARPPGFSIGELPNLTRPESRYSESRNGRGGRSVASEPGPSEGDSLPVSQKPIVYIVDDDKGVRDSLRWLIQSSEIDVECVCYASAQEFLDAYKDDRCGCVIVDVRMPGMGGLELQQRLAARAAAIPVIVISGHADVRTAVEAMRSGAIDFLEKPFRDQELLSRIRQAIQKDEGGRREQALRNEAAARYALLSRREREVMHLVVAGWPNKDIGQRLNIVRKTVEVHRSGLMHKMGATNLPDLVRLSVLLEGMPEPPPVAGPGSEDSAEDTQPPPD